MSAIIVMGGLQHLIVPHERDHFLDAEDAMAGAIEAVGLAWRLGFGRRSRHHHRQREGECSANRQQPPALPRAGKKYQFHKCSPVVERGPTRRLPPSVPLSRNKTKTIAGGTIVDAVHNNNGLDCRYNCHSENGGDSGPWSFAAVHSAFGRVLLRHRTAAFRSRAPAVAGQRPSAVLSVSAASSRRSASEQRNTRSVAGRPLRRRG